MTKTTNETPLEFAARMPKTLTFDNELGLWICEPCNTVFELDESDFGCAECGRKLPTEDKS